MPLNIVKYRKMKRIVFCFLISNLLLAGEKDTAWKYSVVTLTAASFSDAASSFGKEERNPLLRSSDGTFGVKGSVIKGMITGSLVGAQFSPWFRRHRKVLTVLNFSLSSLYVGVTIHNVRVNR